MEVRPAGAPALLQGQLLGGSGFCSFHGLLRPQCKPVPGLVQPHPCAPLSAGKVPAVPAQREGMRCPSS